MRFARHTTRSAFLLGTTAGLAGITAFSPTPAAQFEYKLGSTLPGEHPTSVRMRQAFAAVKAETNGRFSATVYADSQLGGESSIISQTRLGAIQFFILGSSVSTLVPLVNLIGIPFAFESTKPAFAAFDGDLGAYILKDFEPKGLYAFPTVMDLGMRHFSDNVRPVKTPSDLAGLKIRTSAAKINEDFFKVFGASPVSVPVAESYSALQTHIIDGVETALALIDGARWSEVLKYVSLTNHIWSNLYLFGNPAAMKALPPDIRASLDRNCRKYALLERRDSTLLNAALVDKMQREGLVFNNVDMTPFRRQLAAQYRTWKAEFGPSAWDLLEKYAGKLT